ncbi:HD domain-containing protein [Actinoplanes sp. CA-054009]
MGDWGPLGGVLRAEASDRDRANVKDLVSYARSLLKLVRETFPSYTMHDEQHSENVIRLMGRLAAPRIERMSGLEAALLILAAYFHDAGMAYSPAEIAAIPAEDEFRAFLDGHDEAYVATQRNGGEPPPAVIEQYCRSRHADRVRVHLDRCDRGLLQWDGKSIIDQLELVCRSHNEPAAALHEPRFRTDFLFRADLRFCAIMLRLADILDLDDTRAPRVIYEHLGLASHTSPEVAASDREWHKHLASRGFEFPPAPRPNYRLQFSAEPADPGDEHHLRAFLKIIEDELLQCRSVADFCDERWRALPLPAEIDTSGIRSDGYRYGEFRFELDRAAVLELFTGDKLYNDHFAFARELLQNALDAVRARHHLYGHDSAGVRVWCWEEEGGYLWLRVDDDGIGMDEVALRDYFLRVGRSYYRSTEFEAALARNNRSGRPFGAISRFGIGLLACFMAGDRIELSSLPAKGGKAVRLRIGRQDDYFVLQEQGMRGDPMPGPGGPEPPFPSAPGTRIAVRIDAHHTGFALGDLLAQVPRFLFAPPVPVTLNGRPASQATARLLTDPMLAEAEVVELDTIDLRLGHEEVALGYASRLRIAAVPLDLTRDGGCPDVSGQVLLYTVLPPEPAADPPNAFDGLMRGDRREPKSLELYVKVHGSRYVRLPAYRIPLSVLPGGAAAADSESRRNSWGYNGIALPDLSRVSAGPLLATDHPLSVAFGSLHLSNDLRPDLTVSRSGVAAVPFPVLSAVHLATRRALRKATAAHPGLQSSMNGRRGRLQLSIASPAGPCTVAVLRNDRLLMDGSWSSEEMSDWGRSVDSLRALAQAGVDVRIPLPFTFSWNSPQDPDFDFDEIIAAALLHFFVDVEWAPEHMPGARPHLIVTSSSAPRRPGGADAFAPMFAVPFRGSPGLARAANMMNARHPLTRWLIDNSATLAESFPALFRRVFREAGSLRGVHVLNTALEQVARTRKVPAPPPEAYLREDDNGWWWSL